MQSTVVVVWLDCPSENETVLRTGKSLAHGDKVKSIEVVILIAFKPWGSPLFFCGNLIFSLVFQLWFEWIHYTLCTIYFLIPAYLHLCPTRLASCVVMTCPWPQNDFLYRQHNVHACTSHMSTNESGVCIMLYILLFSGSCMKYLKEKKKRLILFSKASSSDGTIFTFIHTVRKITEIRDWSITVFKCIFVIK